MSTRGNIAYRDESSTNAPRYKVIYNHSDSYVSWLGKLLFTEYNSELAAKTLVDAGDCSNPKEPYTGRGEPFEDVEPQTMYSTQAIHQNEFSYLWYGGAWHVTSDGTNWELVETALKREE